MTDTIVVATLLAYDNQPGTAYVLHRLAAQTRLPDAVVVIDNGSVPPLQPVENLPGSHVPVEWRRLAVNVGVGAGHNMAVDLGVTMFGADAIWLLEHDSFPDDGCLAELLRCRARVDLPTIVQSSISRNNYERRWLPDPTGAPIASDRFTFNGVLIDTDVFSVVGRVREDFFVGHEDHDYARRAKAAEMMIWTCPGAVVVHRNKGNGRFAREASPGRLYYSVRNEIVFDERSCVGRAKELVHGLGAGAIEMFRPGYGWDFARARWRGTADGLRGRLGRRW